MSQILNKAYNINDYINKKIHKWTILRKTNEKGATRVEVVCECGNKSDIVLFSLLNNGTKQCRKCSNILKSQNNKTHGLSKTSTYKTYNAMINRCTKPITNSYEYYGGRGIKVCERWMEKFENFVEDMGFKPEEHVLDRIDIDGNYEPSNCRWISIKENNSNRRKNNKEYVYIKKNKLCSDCLAKV